MICDMAKAQDNKSIQISADAMDAVERMLGVYGVRITKKDLIERIILWMDAQTDVVKGSIMGTIPPSHRVDVAKLELERLANSGGGSGKPSGPKRGDNIRTQVSTKVGVNRVQTPKAPQEQP